MASPEAMKAAREWLIEWNNKQKLHPSQDTCAAALAELLETFARERVLAEAKWWRHLVIMHEESYFAVEGDKRIKQLEESVKS